MAGASGTSVAGRLTAVVVIVLCAGVLGYYHRDDLFPPEKAEEAALNPDFVKCRDERAAQVGKMKAEGLIGDEQVRTFTDRAIAFCTAQFPPDASAAN